MKPTKPRGLNHSSVQDLIQTINSTYNCPVRELESLINLALSPLVGGEPSGVSEMSLVQIKEKIAIAWGQSSYAELQKDKEWRLYHKSTKMNGRLRETWLVHYREWVKLPDDELNLSDANNVVNGINIFQNFRPWEVFALDKKTASVSALPLRLLSFRTFTIHFPPTLVHRNWHMTPVLSISEPSRPFSALMLPISA